MFFNRSLRELKETYEELSDKLQECRSQLEQQVANWSQYTQSYDELDLWLCENDALFKGRLVLAADLKDKEAQLGKYKYNLFSYLLFFFQSTTQQQQTINKH